MSPALAGGFFTNSATREVEIYCMGYRFGAPHLLGAEKGPQLLDRHPGEGGPRAQDRLYHVRWLVSGKSHVAWWQVRAVDFPHAACHGHYLL